jgi:hypothetical protein
MEQYKKDALDELTGIIKEKFDESQRSPESKYVVAYKRKSDDSLIGYHLSTFCQVTDDKFLAKRYEGENPYSQLQTIHNNIKHVLSIQEGDTSFLAEVKLEIKNTYFPGITIDDIYLDAEYLDDAPKQTIVFTHIEGK